MPALNTTHADKRSSRSRECQSTASSRSQTRGKIEPGIDCPLLHSSDHLPLFLSTKMRPLKRWQCCMNAVIFLIIVPGLMAVCDERYSDHDGADYRGCQMKTRSGLFCQHWDAQVPHGHKFTPDKYPELQHNYCRNPDGSETIWCYTSSDTKLWEYCDPLMEAVGVQCFQYGVEYQGTGGPYDFSNLVGFHSASDHLQCQQLCKGTPSCEYFTFFKFAGGGMCHLKSSYALAAKVRVAFCSSSQPSHLSTASEDFCLQ